MVLGHGMMVMRTDVRWNYRGIRIYEELNWSLSGDDWMKYILKYYVDLGMDSIMEMKVISGQDVKPSCEA